MTSASISMYDKSMLNYERHKKIKRKKKSNREQRYAWHVVSCVAEKKQEEKKYDWFCSSYMYSLSIMSNTRLCHCCFSAMRKKKERDIYIHIYIHELL